MNADLSYNEAVSNLEKVLAKGGPGKADVFLTRCRGRRFIVKDFGNKGFFDRNLCGRAFIAFELRAYDALAGTAGVPSRYQRLTPFCLAIEYLEGRDLGSIDRSEIGADVMRQFETVVNELHARGWVHLDLHRRSNILLVDGKVYVVDLASAFHTGGIPLIGRCLTRLIGAADRLSLIKMKNYYTPELLTAEEQKWLRLRNLVMPKKW